MLCFSTWLFRASSSRLRAIKPTFDRLCTHDVKARATPGVLPVNGVLTFDCALPASSDELLAAARDESPQLEVRVPYKPQTQVNPSRQGAQYTA